MGRRLVRGGALAAALSAADLPATTDVAEVVGLLSRHPAAVLVPPPTVEPSTFELDRITWQLVVLSSAPVGTLAAWTQLDDALDTLDDALEGYERALPSAYQLPDGTSRPAYLVTRAEDT